MSFPAEILRSGIRIANTLTKGVQSTIIHEPWIGQEVHGDDEYDLPVELLAVIERTNKVITQGDEQVTIAAILTFVGDIEPNGAPGRREPIDPRDRITLPDGFTGPVVDIKGVTDPGTNRGFTTEVLLGAR